jgi:hypothetical protein
MSATTGYREERRELETILHSDAFVRAPGLASFLAYVSEKYFQGEAGQIKEYNIAIEAFGRSPDFNQKQDSVVRVEAHRLRKRLREYYQSEGADHAIHIVMPPGQYVPQFISRLESAGGSASDPVTATDLAAPEAHLPATVLPAPIPPAVPAMPPGWKGSRAQTYFALFAGIALVLLLGAFALARWRSDVPSPAVAASPATPLPEEIRILAGAPDTHYVDHLGNTWLGDRFFNGGAPVATPGHRIWRTNDPSIFQVRREGTDFSYDIPLKAGRYELHLYFAESVFGEENVAGGGETSRIFQVRANGSLILDGLDVTSDAGGANIADEKVFAGITPAPDGALHLQFHLIKESAILNGIAILPAPSGKPRPIRILARDFRYTDRKGQDWLPDRYFSRGQTVIRPEAIEGTPDPEVYRGERFGHFTYAIPVAQGRYAVHLRFNEAWFGPGRPGGGGAGSRIFDVYANGLALLRNFDLYQVAGGPNRAIERTFHGLTPNAQGKIVLSFVPVRNYGCINAIEVVDESS